MRFTKPDTLALHPGGLLRKVAGTIACAMLTATLVACQSAELSAERPPRQKSAGQLLFEEKCQTVAGEKIYRKVENVEGVLLLKVRPNASEREWADRMWPGAAFAREAFGDSYINTFLGYEYATGDALTGKPDVITPTQRGSINTARHPGGLPGYRYVDVTDEKDGKRYRYTGSERVVGKKDTSAPNVQLALRANPNYDLNVYRYVLDKASAPDSAPRYGVTFEDHVIPEDRALGIASSTIKVIDLQTNEVLGELTRYAWRPSGPSRVNPVPWLSAYRCPDHAVGTSAATRKFVDQIAIPAKEK